MKKLIAGAGITAVIAGSALGVAACSSGPAPPPSAISVLQSNGYTPDAAFTRQIQPSVGSVSGVSSLEAGENGNNIQLVIVADSPTLAGAAAAGAQSQLANSPGITVNTNGDVVTITGTLTAWAAVGS